VEAGLITDDERREAEYSREATGRRIGVVLVERNLVNGGRMAQTLSYHFSLPWVSLEHVRFSPKLLQMIPRHLAEEHGVIPVHIRRAPNGKMTLYVATDDPTSKEAVRACREASGMPVRLMVATPTDIQMTIAEEYGALEEPPTTRHEESLADTSPEGQLTSPTPPRPPPPRGTMATVPDPRPMITSVPEHTPSPPRPIASPPEPTPSPPRPPLASVPDLAPSPPRPSLGSVAERSPLPRPAAPLAPERTPVPRVPAPSTGDSSPRPPTIAPDTRPSPAFQRAQLSARSKPQAEPEAQSARANGAPAPRTSAPDLSAEKRVPPPPPNVRSSSPNLAAQSAAALDIVSPPAPAVARGGSSPPAARPPEPDDELELEDLDEVSPTVRRFTPSEVAAANDEASWDDALSDRDAVGFAPPPPPPPPARSGDDAASMPPPPGAFVPPPPPPPRAQDSILPWEATPDPGESEPESTDEEEGDLDVEVDEWSPPQLGDKPVGVPVERSGERLVEEPATTRRAVPNPRMPEHVVPTPRSVAELAVLLVVGAQPDFVQSCERIAARLRARVQTSALMSAEARVRECKPFAVLVPEEVYSFDRYAFTKLGIQAGVPVVVWTDELDEAQAFDLLRAARDASMRK